jgi:hypothetical protein
MKEQMGRDEAMPTAPEASLDDENGNCRRCGHPFNPHNITTYDVTDFSKGGEMRCPVEGCSCFAEVSFDLKP